MTGDQKLEYSEVALADDYLWQAFDALTASGNRERLGIARPPADKTGNERALHVLANAQLAWQKRLSFTRTSILFSALGVEAAANLYLRSTLDDKDVEALDRLRTPDKLLVAPRVAGHGEVFPRDQHPMGDVIHLFTLRNHLVHPKVGSVKVGRSGALTGKRGYEDFNPQRAAAFLIAGADVLARLAGLLDEPRLFGPMARRVAEERDLLRSAAKGWRDKLPDPPMGLYEMVMRQRAQQGRQTP